MRGLKAFGEKARVVRKVQSAGKKTSLLEQLGDVAEEACVAANDVSHFRWAFVARVGRGAKRWRALEAREWMEMWLEWCRSLHSVRLFHLMCVCELLKTERSL